jgi:hypothetical protein
MTINQQSLSLGSFSLPPSVNRVRGDLSRIFDSDIVFFGGSARKAFFNRDDFRDYDFALSLQDTFDIKIDSLESLRDACEDVKTTLLGAGYSFRKSRVYDLPHLGLTGMFMMTGPNGDHVDVTIRERNFTAPEVATSTFEINTGISISAEDKIYAHQNFLYANNERIYLINGTRSNTSFNFIGTAIRRYASFTRREGYHVLGVSY